MGLFGTNGVRGILGSDLGLGDIHAITMSIATHIGRGPILVGRDGRDTSGPISSMVLSSLCYAGIDCADAGLVPTPSLEVGVRDLGYAGGIMVTASHNPPEYGGLKLVWADGVEAARAEEAQIAQIHSSRAWRHKKPWGAVRPEARLPETYRRAVLGRVDAARISGAGLSIVLDMGNGAQSASAGPIASALCESVGLVHDNVDPAFGGRGPEPRPDNLGALSDAVRSSGADLGVAFDGDGDRSMICDERGRVLSGDVSALFLADYLLGLYGPADIVTPINSGDAIEDIAARTQSRVIRTSVGSVVVSRRMLETGALAGFEENGGFMYGRHLPVRDGSMTMALALEALAAGSGSLSAMVGGLPRSFTAKTSVACEPGSAPGAVSALARGHDDADTRDGVKIRLGPHEWVMARPSGTEPIIRIYAESGSESKTRSLLDEYSEKIRRLL